MTQFGKRTASTGASSRPEAEQADLAAALAVVKAGKLPHWVTIGPVSLVVALLAAAAGFCFMTVTYAGDILRDIRLAGTWQAAYDLRAVDGSCTRHNFVITFCSAKITSLAKPDQAPVAREFMMGFSSGGGEVLVPVRSTVDPSAVAIAYAAETKLTNRTLTFIVVAGGLAALFVGLVCALLQGRYKGGRAHRALLSGFAELKAQVGNGQAEPHATA